MAGSETVIEIRPLSALAEFSEALRLQQLIWGFADSELLPLRFFVVAHRIGGQVLGAYRSGEMVGFCLAVPGLKPDGRVIMHSHMLGVLPPYRNLGIGKRLKMEQRIDAIARGINLVEWTFDPLDLKNAFFNIERLGVIIRRYEENAYGTTSSPLHGGLPTDRCVAEWYIHSAHARTVLSGSKPAARVEEHIAVPSDIEQIRREDPGLAREIQRGNATRFLECFGRGLEVTGFKLTATEGVYSLGKLE